MWREADDGFCYFRELMKYESPLELSLVVDSAQARNEIVDSMEMIQVIIWASVDRPMADSERSELSKDMELLCQDVPIVKMWTQRVTMEQFERNIAEAGECYTGHTKLSDGKIKRAATLTQKAAASCSSCYHGGHGGGPVIAKRSAGSQGLGFNNLVHLIIGHEKFDCE